jgi:hypothetical protein
MAFGPHTKNEGERHASHRRIRQIGVSAPEEQITDKIGRRVVSGNKARWSIGECRRARTLPLTSTRRSSLFG